MEAIASAKYLRGSAQKARLVVDMIRGKDVNQALAILRFSKKRAASHVEKCMRSAIANANEAAEKANISIDPDDLWVRTAFVDRGPTKNRRRVRPAPQGRAYREQRHFCPDRVLSRYFYWWATLDMKTLEEQSSCEYVLTYARRRTTALCIGRST